MGTSGADLEETGSHLLPQATLEVRTSDGSSQSVPLVHMPFEIGRGGEGESRLKLSDVRVSRHAAVIVHGDGGFLLRDLGQRKGLFLNEQRVVEAARLADGDVISFGNTDAVRLVFRTDTGRESISSLLSRLDESARREALDQNLHQLNLLLEATALLQTQMPAEEVLGAMVEQAISITAADRGALLEADSEGELQVLVARRTGGGKLPAASYVPSHTAIERALRDKRALIELDLDRAGDSVKMAQSIVNQQLRSVIAIPLYSRIHPTPDQPGETGALLGVLYLDSRQPAAFRGLGRQVLDALATEAASVIDNAQMVEKERERRQMEQDLSIARGIQQKLLPKELGRYGFVEIAGTNESCHSVGGDYFDLVELERGRLAFIIADVAGKGLAAALLTAILQGGFAGVTLTPDLARLLGHLNRYVWGRSEPNRFATAFLGVIDREGSLEYINAGHLPALLIRTSGEIISLESRSFPIGMFPDSKFESSRAALEAGDVLVTFTDGVTEAQNAGGEEFGMERLSRFVGENRTLPVEQLRLGIADAVAEFSQGEEFDDDMTLLIFRYTGA